MTSHLLLHVSDGARQGRHFIAHLLDLQLDQRVLLGALGPQGGESGLLLLLQEAPQDLKLLPDALLGVLALVLGRDGTVYQRCASVLLACC